MKRECAQAAYNLIKEGMTIGLGEGRIIQYLLEFVQMGNKNIKVVTPSLSTALQCKEYGITVLPTYLTDHTDITFTECSQVDASLNAMKTTGQLPVQDKIVAAMSNQFILLASTDNFVQKLSFEMPVRVEVIPEAFSYVKRKLEGLGAQVAWNTAPDDQGGIQTDHGDFVLMAAFHTVKDVAALNAEITSINGVVETSLYTDVADAAIIGTPEGVKTIEK